jgi:vacuolar-type H+-ATPase subunit F/Vma7
LKVLFLTPADAEPGFGLAAAQQRVCAPEDLHGALEAAMEDEAVGVIAVDERLLKAAGRQVLAEREARWPGVLVVLPPPEFAEYRAEEYITELIRRTIGYHVRLRP